MSPVLDANREDISPLHADFKLKDTTMKETFANWSTIQWVI